MFPGMGRQMAPGRLRGGHACYVGRIDPYPHLPKRVVFQCSLLHGIYLFWVGVPGILRVHGILFIISSARLFPSENKLYIIR